MIRVRRIDHVALRIDDVAITKTFYADLLGLAPVRPDAAGPGLIDDLQKRTGMPRPSGGIWFQVPGSQIHLIEAGKGEGGPNPFGPHVALEVENFEEAKQTLASQGIPFVEVPDGGAFRQMWLNDPSGNTIELWARR